MKPICKNTKKTKLTYSKTILVTGGLGFIGGSFIDFCLEELPEIRIHCLDKVTYSANRNRLARFQIDPRISVFIGDICNNRDVEAAMGGCSDVFHFAAESHVPKSFEMPDVFMKTNAHGTGVLTKIATKKNIERFIHISTDEVYGSTTDFVDESFPVSPTTPYAYSKAMAEDKVVIARAGGLDAIIIRPTNVVGVGQHCEKVVPKFVQRVIAGQATQIEGNGSQTRAFLPVGDLCHAIILAWQDSPKYETYNIPGNEIVSICDLAEIIWFISGKTPQIVTVPDRKVNDHDYLLDAQKIAKLGYVQKSTLLLEIKKIFEHLQFNQNSKYVG